VGERERERVRDDDAVVGAAKANETEVEGSGICTDPTATATSACEKIVSIRLVIAPVFRSSRAEPPRRQHMTWREHSFRKCVGTSVWGGWEHLHKQNEGTGLNTQGLQLEQSASATNTTQTKQTKNEPTVLVPVKDPISVPRAGVCNGGGKGMATSKWETRRDGK
jgi:hypothetical protein